MLKQLVILSVLSSALCALSDLEPNEIVYYTREIIEAEGYKAETHHATTKDGYILELHRIPFGKDKEGPEVKPVVFLMHGLLGASNSYIFLGPEYSLAYNLADAGFDVWMGNARGTRNSRHHVSLDPDMNKGRFFDFTFEEIALDDLPTMIDYVLEYTGQEKLHYIGHSQGGTVFMILNSMKTEYNEKFASAHLLAGVGYQSNFPNNDLRSLSIGTDLLYDVLRLAGNVELFPPGSDSILGNSDISSRGTVDSILNIDSSSGLIGGGATKQVAHFGQNIRDKVFRRWNFGRLQNLARYGSTTPPAYDLSKIRVDVTLHYSLSDILLHENDVLLMAKSMPNAKARKVARESFGHLDYVISKDSKELIWDYIIEALNDP